MDREEKGGREGKGRNRQEGMGKDGEEGREITGVTLRVKATIRESQSFVAQNFTLIL